VLAGRGLRIGVGVHIVSVDAASLDADGTGYQRAE
jgi:hypothetical protein